MRKGTLSAFSYYFFTICILFFIFSKNTYSRNLRTEKTNFPIEFTVFLFFPDSINEDTSQIAEESVKGDTIETYTSGGDSIFILYEDSTTIDSLYENLWTIGTTEHMLVELTEHHHTINQDLLGYCLSDFFSPGHANAAELEEIYNLDPDPWDKLSEFKPKSLRFPSGADGKFMEPLGSIYSLDPLDDYYLWKNGGYGFNINDIIPFYDITDGAPGGAPTLSAIITDITSVIEPGCTDCDEWMHEDWVEQFEGFFWKWYDQPIFDPDGLELHQQPDLYINDFIELIKQIETENGYTVDVIVCINIMTQSASEAKAMIEYLMDDTHHYPVNVVGVEIGNEVYFDYGRQMMGFKDEGEVSAFIHYWDYINGHEYTDATIGEDEDDGMDAGDGEYDGDLNLINVLPNKVLIDHDFISALKDDIDLDIKVGLPAMNLNKCDEPGGDVPFIIDPRGGIDFDMDPPVDDCECDYPDWNDDLATKYSKQIYGGTELRYKFDAAILHPYYTPFNAKADCTGNTNWQEIPTCLADGDLPYDTEWTYTGSPDSRLKCAFYGISGIPYPTAGSPLLTGNFKTFAKDRIKYAYDMHSTHLFFTAADDGPETKEIWTTEWNIHDDASGTPEDMAADQPYVYTIPNTFSHAVTVAHWTLWNIKSYFDDDYRPGFLTTATMQNFLAPTNIALMFKADRQDEVELDIAHCDVDPDDFIKDYYIPKTTYFMMQLMNSIADYNLNYAKSHISLYSGNCNLPPSVFYDQIGGDIENVYVYYTNVKPVEQKYAIDPGDLYIAIDGATSVELGAATLYMLDPTQLYSTAGRHQLFEYLPLNNYYGECEEDFYDYRMEITSTSSEVSTTTCPTGIGTAPDGGVCVTVPATSAGYFIIPITVYRLGEMEDIFALYPNPASTHFTIQQLHTRMDEFQNLEIEIYSINGSLITRLSVNEGQQIDISQLPVGLYNVVIKYNGMKTQSESLIKMK